MTINEALVLTKVVRERVNDLRSLRNKVSTRESYLYSATEKRVIEPEYDVKAVDRKVMELETFLLMAETAIKNANATTQISITVDTGKLLEPIA